MKIDVIKIIQNALIGGQNGQMAFIYNNHFVRELFDSFEFEYRGDGDYESAKFKAFIFEILKDCK